MREETAYNFGDSNSMEVSEEQIRSLTPEKFNDIIRSLFGKGPDWDVGTIFPFSRSDLDEGTIFPFSRSDFKDRLFHYANVAVDYHNRENRSNQFEIVDPLYYAHASDEDYHLSFIARSKEDSTLLKLFFAQVSPSDDNVMARKCIIVEPCNPLFVTGCSSYQPCNPEGVIYHPLFYLDPSDDRLRPRPQFIRDRGPQFIRDRVYFAKRLLSEAYIITSFEQNLNAEEMNELKVATCGYVREALFVYNEEHGASFKPLRIVASVRFGCSDPYGDGERVWVHFVFMATNKDPHLIDASPTYFFAERGLLLEDTTTCVMMGDTYPSSAYPGTETKCAVCRVHCPKMVVHPEDYRAGRNGGNLADVLDKGQSRTVKAKLEQKDGDSSEVARLEYLKALEQ